MNAYSKQKKQLEANMQAYWLKNSIFHCKEGEKRPTYVILPFFPYPSGLNLHVGHAKSYIGTDVVARYKRSQGFNVLHACGMDSFGLPAELHAIKTNQHPSIKTAASIEKISRQMKEWGLSYDNKRFFSTSDPSYYQWTQYIVSQLYNAYYDTDENKAKPICSLISKLEKLQYSKECIKKIVQENRLLYQDFINVNWCPGLGTVLSNEEIINGVSERGQYQVLQKPLKQWVFRITKYAERLLANLNTLDWPENIKTMQRNWIGKSTGYLIDFACTSYTTTITVFTTRPDTILGVTFIAISQLHTIAQKVLGKRTLTQNEVVMTEYTALHPVTGKKIPVIIADYVVDYGTQAIMGVPAHDARDYDIAVKHNLDIIVAIQGGTIDKCYEQKGLILDSKNYFNFTTNDPVKQNTEVIKHIKARPLTAFKIKPWLFSRQRFWGEPMPFVYDIATDECFLLDRSQLPLTLPEQQDFAPILGLNEPITPLARNKKWSTVTGYITANNTFIASNDPSYNLRTFYRDPNTMPNWAGSCWYYMRYLDPQGAKTFATKKSMNYWSNDKSATVDMYIGGAEHAVLHLLYARFWHMALYDLQLVNTPEPFYSLRNPGPIKSTAYYTSEGAFIDKKDLSNIDGNLFCPNQKPVTSAVIKMSKSALNGVNPDDIVSQYSADVLRLYTLYIGPFEKSTVWNDAHIIGMERLCTKIFNLLAEFVPEDDLVIPSSTKKISVNLQKACLAISRNIETLSFNTAIAEIIKYVNQLNHLPHNDYLPFLSIIQPFAPHISEYFYQKVRVKFELPIKSIIDIPYPQVMPCNANNVLKIKIYIDGKFKRQLSLERKLNTSDIAHSTIDDVVQNIIQEYKLGDAYKCLKLKNNTVISFIKK